jgi:hypothetical protein
MADSPRQKYAIESSIDGTVMPQAIEPRDERPCLRIRDPEIGAPPYDSVSA